MRLNQMCDATRRANPVKRHVGLSLPRPSDPAAPKRVHAEVPREPDADGFPQPHARQGKTLVAADPSDVNRQDASWLGNALRLWRGSSAL
jgi:hypothetical protein